MKNSPNAAPLPSPSVVDPDLEVRLAHERYIDTLRDPVENQVALANLRTKYRQQDLAMFREASVTSTEIAEIDEQIMEAQRALATATQVAYAAPRVPFVEGQDSKARETLVRELQAANDDDVWRKRIVVKDLTDRLRGAQNRQSDRIREQRRLGRNTAVAQSRDSVL